MRTEADLPRREASEPTARVRGGAGSFLGVFLGGIGGVIVWVLYFVVRNENGAGAPSVREDS